MSKPHVVEDFEMDQLGSVLTQPFCGYAVALIRSDEHAWIDGLCPVPASPPTLIGPCSRKFT